MLYHASTCVVSCFHVTQGKESSIQGLQVPWPPVVADMSIEKVQEIVQPTLFNFLAWFR